MHRKAPFVGLSLLAMALAARPAHANIYDRDDSDHPLRYIAYVLHPLGVAVEYGLLRPIHGFMHGPTSSRIFGHELIERQAHFTPGAPAPAATAPPPAPAIEQPTQQTRPVQPATPAPAGVSETRDREGSTRLTMLSELLFASGSAQLTPEGQRVLDQVVERIGQFPADRPIIVEGHTDTDPIVHSGWPSNWHLGAARAIAVVQYLVSRGVAPARCGATTYSEYRPVRPNATPQDKAANRRVAVLIMAPGATPPPAEAMLPSAGTWPAAGAQ